MIIYLYSCCRYPVIPAVILPEFCLKLVELQTILNLCWNSEIIVCNNPDNKYILFF
jgi:hypothetical protein